ncbi:unnamed protein product [Microthlaspi erraticum]|uniref:DUF220 domain-containing protein n=1 Tax=Microthlaspi erraticum TaxID=1685480 RepID=A0A6D2JGK1_9BRAS|nr:unnamed protein product [Microthlaspi erraticum]
MKVNYEEGDDEEQKQQNILWSDAERQHPWYDAPPRLKVTTKNGLRHMNIELTMGIPPEGVYDFFINPNSIFYNMGRGQQLLGKKSRKVLKKDGPREIAKLEKTLPWNFLWWSGSLPVTLIVDGKYKKEKMMFMKVFEGNWKVEPLYVDQERLCKNMLPNSREEYRKCSGGQGKIASKVIMNQYFKPSSLLNLPPLSWCISGITVKTTKTILQIIQNKCAVHRELPFSAYYKGGGV